MDTRVREAIRYLGYGKHAVDDKIMTLIESAFEELDKTVKYRIIYRIFELEVSDSERVKIGKMDIKSKNLAKNMRGCNQAVMLGATLGIEVDFLMKRYSLTEMSRAVVLQACAAAMLEDYLDRWQFTLSEEMKDHGYYLRPRFSPGYGDFSIDYQEEILKMTDTARRIGLSMTDGNMLTPSKSVTAVIGISREKTACHMAGCEVCEKRDCMYRRSSV